MNSLTLGALRDANKARHVEWWEPGTENPGVSLEFRGVELAGETGEACNIIKKLARERMGIKGSRATKEQLAEELADVVICADLAAMDVGIDLGAAIAAKFNATSEKVGLNTRLTTSPDFVSALIQTAMKTPYTHLNGQDGSLYMGRFWLHPYSEDKQGMAARVHHIARPDNDRHLHDHPWKWFSIVLRGWYVEAVPAGPEPEFDAEGREKVVLIRREAGHFVAREPTDRHQIVEVGPDTYTLFITGPKVQEWGFYTPDGKVPWRMYLGLPADAKE